MNSADLVNKELKKNPFLENQNDEEDFNVGDETTDDLNNSFESGESLSDEQRMMIMKIGTILNIQITHLIKILIVKL